MKKGKYLKFYENCMVEGRMPRVSLCECFENDESLLLFEPTDKDREQIIFDGHSWLYWGSGTGEWSWHDFTPLRQTIVLFMAAMNKEL